MLTKLLPAVLPPLMPEERLERTKDISACSSRNIDRAAPPWVPSQGLPSELRGAASSHSLV